MSISSVLLIQTYTTDLSAEHSTTENPNPPKKENVFDIVAGPESFLSPVEPFHWQPPMGALRPGPNRKLQISLNKRETGEATEGAALSDGAETRKTAVDVAGGGMLSSRRD